MNRRVYRASAFLQVRRPRSIDVGDRPFEKRRPPVARLAQSRELGLEPLDVLRGRRVELLASDEPADAFGQLIELAAKRMSDPVEATVQLVDRARDT